ncbi:hypothetical protein [Dyadobacter sp. CY312]|uniref:hypothetical protein n=1 Tax=Dyadobacter sp. CY312 TaxID=2907303 RepID=UPI001F426719|nr:hypothetical protein [Dyadobacter sp. CY312]MCE7039249.1 hypothetical protein [Dyadobacter sp. CY312]
MATYITRQSIEGDLLITNERVGDGCWTDGEGDYIPNSLSLVIDGTEYPIAAPQFFGFGYFNVFLPAGVFLKGGDSVRLKSNCSADDSIAVITLPIDLVLTTSNASTCNNTSPIKATYKDRIRVFIGGREGDEVFNLSVNGTPLNVNEFFKQTGSLGTLTSTNGDWKADPVENSIYFSNNLYSPTSEIKIEIIDDTAYSTVRFGYLEAIFSTGELYLIDYIGDAEEQPFGTFANGDIIEIESTPGSYIVKKNGTSFYTAEKTVDYTLPTNGGSITPDPSVAGIDSTWTLPTTPGNYAIQVKLGGQITAVANATISPCQLTADPKTSNANKGTLNNVIPPLSGGAPTNCNVASYKIKSLPACGTLKLNGAAVADEQTIALADISNLRIDIPANCPGTSVVFTYASVSNLPGCQESTPVNITVNLASGTADAIDDSFSGPKGTPIVHNVSTNDVKCTVGNTFYELVAGSAQNGTVSAFDQNTGAATFTPVNANYVGPAQYQYRILCGLTLGDAVPMDTATVKLSFFGGDAVDDTNTTYRDEPVNGNVSTNDTATCDGPVTYQVISGSAQNGSVTDFNTVTGAYTFLPAVGFIGQAQFRYNLLCNGIVIDTATVRITVAGSILNPDRETTPINTPISGTIEDNDTFTCTEPVSFALVAGSEFNGTVSNFNPTTGQYTFTPALNFTGVGGFKYEAFCGTTKVGETTVEITILPSCDICAELKIIKQYFKALHCDIEFIKKHVTR